MLATAPGFAQAKWPIRTLAVEGNRFYSTAEILSASGLKIGGLAGKPEFDAAHDRLLTTGAFSTVGYRFNVTPAGACDAAFQVTENEVLPVRFYNLGVPDAGLEAYLHAQDPLFSAARLPSIPDVIARWTQSIQDYLAARHLDSKIMGGVEPWPEQLAIVFRPAKNLPAVAEVTFTGGRVVPNAALQTYVTGAAVGAPYTEDHFRIILDAAIRPVYEARGYMRVTFPQIRSEPATDVLGLHIFVTVNEGEPYKFGKIDIPGATIKSGDPANFDRVNSEIERLRASLRHTGYLNAKVSSDRQIHDAEKTVDIEVRSDPGPQYVLGKLSIEGLDLNGEAEIRRIWTIKRGAPFDPDYPAQFLDRVRREGLFDNLGKTTPTTKIDEKDQTVDVTLTFATPPRHP
jgi:outer membrane protein assembly factor BamA